jgi:hypothetical protein
MLSEFYDDERGTQFSFYLITSTHEKGVSAGLLPLSTHFSGAKIF